MWKYLSTRKMQSYNQLQVQYPLGNIGYSGLSSTISELQDGLTKPLEHLPQEAEVPALYHLPYITNDYYATANLPLENLHLMPLTEYPAFQTPKFDMESEQLHHWSLPPPPEEPVISQTNPSSASLAPIDSSWPPSLTSDYHHMGFVPVKEPQKIRRKPCKCPNCKKGLNANTSIQKKQHICHFPGCEKVFKKTSQLRYHLCWHTGERPFVCNWFACGKRFIRSDELQCHIRTHTGEKNYVCMICNKCFMRSDHLNKHLRIH